MSEVKYTTDGKKVRVVGSLNSKETIVQEIFVTEDGSEIPSGENFVVKSLMDKPAVSWKEKDMEERERRYRYKTNELEQEISSLHQTYNTQRAVAAPQIELFRALAEKSPNEFSDDLERLTDLIEGNITHFVTLSPYDPKIDTFQDSMIVQENRVRLLSLLGDSNGNLQFAVNSYSDGSGSRITVLPCRGMEEAVMKLDEYLEYLNDPENLKNVRDKHLVIKEKYGLKNPNKKTILAYRKITLGHLQNRLSELIEQTSETKKKISGIQQQIENARE